MDGQTDTKKQLIALRNFVNAPKKVRKVSSRNFSLALRLLLLGVLLATWGHYCKKVDSYFVCQIVIKGNSCDSETRVGVSTGQNQKTPSILGSCKCCTDWPPICRKHTPKNLPSGTSCEHEKTYRTRIRKDCETDHSIPQKVCQVTISAWCC
jgi:hypothetical protein